MLKLFTALLILYSAHPSYSQEETTASGQTFLAALGTSLTTEIFFVRIDQQGTKLGSELLKHLPAGSASPVVFALGGVDQDGTAILEKIVAYSTARSSNIKYEAKVVIRSIMDRKDMESLPSEIWRSLLWQQTDPSEGFQATRVKPFGVCLMTQTQGGWDHKISKTFRWQENPDHKDSSDMYRFTLYMQTETSRDPKWISQSGENEVFERSVTTTRYLDEQGQPLKPPRLEVVKMTYEKNAQGEVVRSEIHLPDGRKLCAGELK